MARFVPNPDRQAAPAEAPALGPLRRSTRALRSGLRRYPPELLASFLRRGLLQHAGAAHAGPEVRNLLTELAPHGMALIWLGHASIVLTLGNLTIAVDPVLSDRIGPRLFGRTWGLSRRVPAPIPPASLFGIDLLLLTHAHFDHLDRPTLESLASDRTTVIVPIRCARLVPRGFRAVIELAPDASHTHEELAIEAIQPRHWGARMVLDRHRPSLAYALRHREGSILIAGDTAYTNAFAEARDRIGPLDVACFGIGAYDPWEHMHATPEQVWRMHLALGARYLLPIHHSTFELSDEPLDEPVRRLLATAGDDASRVLSAALGEVVVVTRPEKAEPPPEIPPTGA